MVLTDINDHLQNSIVEILICSQQPTSKTVLHHILEGKWFRNIAKVGKHFSDLQGFHHFELLTLIRALRCSHVHYYFGARCSLGQDVHQEGKERYCIDSRTVIHSSGSIENLGSIFAVKVKYTL